MRFRISLTTCALILAAMSCATGSDDAATPTGPAPATTASTDATSATSEEPTAEESTSTSATPASTAPAAVGSTVETTIAPPLGPPLIDGLPTVDLIEPGSAPAGDVPSFTWDAFDGADSYRLVIVSPTEPIWAWQGEDLTVRLGGLTVERPDGMTGPVLVDGSCWSVVALAADQHVIAASHAAPVSASTSADHDCAP